MSITAKQVNELREKTGVGLMDCKKILVETDGNIDQAIQKLREKGLAKAAKKSDRSTNEGKLFISNTGNEAIILELNCETDFAARTPEFRNLAHDIAMQVVSMSPTLVGDEDTSSEIADDGSEEIRLLHQKFVKDESTTIQDLVTEAAAKLGENIKVKRFSRFELGT